VVEDGRPVPNVPFDAFEVINDETGEPFQSEGGSSTIIEARHDFSFYSILVLDLSQSIVANHRLDDELDGARSFVKAMITDQEETAFRHYVAIYVFGSTAESELVQAFTQDAQALYATIESLRDDPGRGSTNLYGAFMTGIDLLEDQGGGGLVVRSLVILTDGTHETGDEETMRRQALDHLDASEVNSYAIGIKGDYDEERLRELASTPDNFFLVEDSAEVREAFGDVAGLVDDWSKSNYVMGVCSPLEGPDRSLTIELGYHDRNADLTVEYDATGFNLTGCDPEAVAEGEGCAPADDDDDDDDDTGEAPEVETVAPADGAEEMPLETEIVVAFSLPMKPEPTEAAITVSGGTDGTFAWTTGNRVVTFTPTGGTFEEDQLYTVTIGTGAEGENGRNLAEPFVWTFGSVDLWTVDYNDALNSSDYGQGIAVADDFAVYAIGEAPQSTGDENIVTIKLDRHGNLVWSDFAVGSDTGSVGGEDVTVAPNGNIAVAGYVDNNVSEQDLWVRMFTAGGAVVWTRTYSQYSVWGMDFGHGVAADASGNVYLCGAVWDREESNNIMIRQYGPSGNDLWSTEIDCISLGDHGQDCVLDEDQNLYVAGVSECNPGLFVRKYGPTHQVEWSRFAASDEGGVLGAQSVDVDGDGNVLVVGSSREGEADADGLLVKLDSEGTEVWRRTYDSGADEDDYFHGVAADPWDAVVVTGGTSHSLGDWGAFVRKFNADGDVLWTKVHYDEDLSEYFVRVATDRSGNVYAVGTAYVVGQAYNLRVRKYDRDGHSAD
jgi:hypothetical protein